MQPILNSLVKTTINCGFRDWLVLHKDKIAVKEPTGRYTNGHGCSKIEVYRQYMSIARVYVVKGDLATKILKNASNKKKSESKAKEAQEHNTHSETEVESKS